MKTVFYYLILPIILYLPINSFSQWAPYALINFDSGDSLWNHAIIIDTVNFRQNIWQVGKPNKSVFTSAMSAPNVIVTDTLNPYPPSDT